MASIFKIASRSIRTAPIREVSFHPVLASHLVSEFIFKRQENDPSMLPNSIGEEQTALDTIKALKNDKNKLYLSALLVKHDDKLAGIISERDIIRKAAVKGRALNKVLVKDIMTKDPKFITEDGSLDEAVELLFQGSFRHLPVVKSKIDHTPVGLLGINDTLRELFRLQVLHKYNNAVKLNLSSLPNGPNINKLGVTHQNDTVLSALQTMSDKEVGSVIVVNDKNHMVGIITEHDYTYKVALKGDDPSTVKVSNVMTPDPVVTFADKSILSGLEMMVNRRHRHIPLLGQKADIKGEIKRELPIDPTSGLNVIGTLSSKHLIRFVYHI